MINAHENFTVGVILPVYYKDDPRMLHRAIRSMLRQSINCDLIVVDDGPLTIECAEVISKYKSRITHLRKENNTGLADTLNFALEFCAEKDYDYIARMDADDFSTRDRLEKQINFMKTNSIQVCGSDYYLTLGSARKLVKMPKTRKDMKKNIIIMSPICHPSVVFHRSITQHIKYNNKTILSEDYELWTRLLKLNLNLGNISEPLLYFNYTDDTSGRRVSYRKILSDMRLRFVALDVYPGKKYYGVMLILIRSIVIALLKNHYARLLTWRSKVL